MAFRILGEDELRRMTDEQIENYEKELQEYNRRCAFVDYMEKLQGMELEAFTVKEKKKVPIPPIEVKEFKTGKYEVRKPAPISTIELETVSFEEIGIEGIEMPLVKPLGDIKSVNFQNTEKPNVASIDLKIVEGVSCEFEGVSVKIENLPQVNKAEAKEFSVEIEPIKVEVPNLELPTVAEIKDFNEIELNAVNLSGVDSSSFEINVADVSKVNEAFSDDKIKDLQDKVSTVVGEISVPNISQMKNPIFEMEGSVDKVEVPKVVLPQSGEMKTGDGFNFNVADIKVELPTIEMTGVKNTMFAQSEKSEGTDKNASAPEGFAHIPAIPKAKIGEMPKIKSVDATSALEALKEYLS